MTQGLITNILGGLLVLLLAGLVRLLGGLHKDFRRFMTEHMWLIATSMWTRDKVSQVMNALGMPIEHPPPDDLPPRR